MNMHMHYFICPRRDPAPVPGKNVALRREAVDLLDREKRPGESYSDVVLRLVPQRWIAWDNAELDAQALDGIFSRNPGYLLPTD